MKTKKKNNLLNFLVSSSTKIINYTVKNALIVPLLVLFNFTFKELNKKQLCIKVKVSRIFTVLYQFRMIVVYKKQKLSQLC